MTSQFFAWFAQVHNKYEALQKEVKRLRKSVRRSLMERPSSIRKLRQLLDKEIEEVDAETAKLAEQVQVLHSDWKSEMTDTDFRN